MRSRAMSPEPFGLQGSDILNDMNPVSNPMWDSFDDDDDDVARALEEAFLAEEEKIVQYEIQKKVREKKEEDEAILRRIQHNSRVCKNINMGINIAFDWNAPPWNEVVEQMGNVVTDLQNTAMSEWIPPVSEWTSKDDWFSTWNPPTTSES